MKRRCLWLGAVLLGSTLVGCDSLHPWHRAKSDEPALDRETMLKDSDSEEESMTRKRFFKPSRLPGALSDEGREVERHLGIE